MREFLNVSPSSHLSKTIDDTVLPEPSICGAPSIIDRPEGNYYLNENKRQTDNEKEEFRFNHEIDIAVFQICQDCFWCATIISYATTTMANKRQVEGIEEDYCPLCFSDNIDKLTICPKETFRLELGGKRGICLFFHA